MSEYTVTTLGAAVTIDADSIVVASATGIAAGYYIYIDREFMKVKASYVSGTTIPVERGTLPGIRSGHASGQTVYVGDADMFLYHDKAGYEASPAQAYIINVITGSKFFNSSGQWYDSRDGWSGSV